MAGVATQCIAKIVLVSKEYPGLRRRGFFMEGGLTLGGMCRISVTSNTHLQENFSITENTRMDYQLLLQKDETLNKDNDANRNMQDLIEYLEERAVEYHDLGDTKTAMLLEGTVETLAFQLVEGKYEPPASA